MVSPATVFGGLSVLLTYFVFKHQTLKTTRELQEEIENRLQPKYDIVEPTNSQILPHTDWPSEDFYFEVWHVEVYETRWMSWKKWLPRGKFQGRTIIHYKVHGYQPPQEQLKRHHLARQPYVQSVKKDHHDPKKVKVIYESVDPSSISTFTSQFRYLIRDSTFHQLNPDADLQYEIIEDDEGNLYARFFDANIQEAKAKS